jgi:hypothetical protein
LCRNVAKEVGIQDSGLVGEQRQEKNMRNFWAISIALAFFGEMGLAVAQAAPPANAQIQQWISDLDDDRFSVREAAAAELLKAGRGAVAPLAKAASEGSVEVTSRGVQILTLLAVDDDLELAEAAREALEALVTPTNPNAATDRAASALENVYVLEADRAREKIMKLGAVHGSGSNFFPSESDTIYPNHLMLRRKAWTGTVSDLKLLKYLQDVNHVSIHGVKLNDEAVGHLSRLRHLTHLELYGTGLKEESVKKLKAALPQLTDQGDRKTFDVRGGGLLGVTGKFDTPNCEFSHVRPNSAAGKAGLQIGDVVTTVDGKPIENFRKFLDYVAGKDGGDKIKLEIQRGETKMQVEVTLNHWGDD